MVPSLVKQHQGNASESGGLRTRTGKVGTAAALPAPSGREAGRVEKLMQTDGGSDDGGIGDIMLDQFFL